MTHSPQPGWYADPAGAPGYRWWDGQAWTSHATAGPAIASPPVVPTPFLPTSGYLPHHLTPPRPAPAARGWQRNEAAFITIGVVAFYALIAIKTHVYVLGILPMLMSIRSCKQREPLAPVAVIFAVLAVVIAVVGLSGHH